jgi:uncharacterized membrane protein
MASVLQVAGAGAIVAGIAWISLPAGLIAAGVVLVLLGIAVSN